MKFLIRLTRRSRQSNPTTVFARQRLGRTMPGETGALTAARLGFLIN
ncbi:hypothetical protein [Nitratireductor pacificus]|uniref:Uncharacterized protein n=1 Tax=Nitratireductor pacificus pht-3B TaxID=391937 RepID=K2LT23_9HYPH|nr:hypothetical protein [Nitratireductor pacificus]EKF20934.1 hypothetical protein NA2_01110 [Nitratireductor pacificus pht-3B]